MARYQRIVRIATGSFASAVALGVLAGCAQDASQDDDTTTSASTTVTAEAAESSSAAASESSSASSAVSSDAEDSGYQDGTYMAEGSYTAPSGSESIEVSVTLESGLITAVDVSADATNSQAAYYQKNFASAIEAEVVGKSLDEVSLSSVAGASLTTQGFETALETIKADARA
ncbi:MAG TPA: hypothetical protein GX406_03915 [Pseudoclavibacter sp.]|nr:hypothetical protein [Pseudoclavibacter sp.]